MIRLGKFWRFGKLVTAIITTILARMRSTVFIKLLAKTDILYQQTTASTAYRGKVSKSYRTYFLSSQHCNLPLPSSVHITFANSNY